MTKYKDLNIDFNYESNLLISLLCFVHYWKLTQLFVFQENYESMADKFAVLSYFYAGDATVLSTKV